MIHHITNAHTICGSFEGPPMILFVASKKDEAGMNIARKVIDLYALQTSSERFEQDPIRTTKVKDTEVKLILIREAPINAQSITDYFDAELIVFMSRHSSLSGIPTLSVHTPGNLTEEAKFGGMPRKVSVSAPSMMRNVLREMVKIREEKNLSYKVSYECTHHGPSLDTPTVFAELGSSPEQWKDLEAAESVARAVMNGLQGSSTSVAALGIGGPHYNEKFTRIALETSVAFGHMIPKYAAPSVDDSMVRQCVERTKERVDLAFIDWKGVRSEDRKRLISATDALGLKIEKV